MGRVTLRADGATQQPVFKFTEAEAAQFSPIRFVSSGSAPSLIVHGDADTSVPIDQGETTCAAEALTSVGSTHNL